MKILLSWQTLILGYLVLICFLLLAGCSSMYVSTTVDQTEYNWQWSFDETEVLD